MYTACNKISEEIQRDIVINDTTYFDIPILADTINPVTISDIKTTANLEEEIGKQVKGFILADITSVKLNSLNMIVGPILKDTNGRDSIDKENNIANFETIKFGIVANGKTGNMGTAAVATKTPASTLTFTVAIVPDTLKPYLTNASKTYSVTIKAKKKTNLIMKAGAAARYTVTLSK